MRGLPSILSQNARQLCRALLVLKMQPPATDTLILVIVINWLRRALKQFVASVRSMNNLATETPPPLNDFLVTHDSQLQPATPR
jgi:hypothetical protein